MRTSIRALIVGAALFSTACGSNTPPPGFTYSPGPGSSPAGSGAPGSPAPAGSPGASGSPPAAIDPSKFVAKVDNAWFPLIPGTTWTYRGVKDDEKAVDTVTVTKATKVILGVTCVVVRDELRLGGKLVESTSDWYAQDAKGNVWYFGEATKELEGSKVVSTEGSWQAGAKGALPGIFMPAAPRVGQSGLQESYPGHAEDRFVVLLRDQTVKVPAGTFKGAMLVAEWTALEPKVLSQKVYVRGIGEIREADVTGGDEHLELTKMTKPS